MKKSAHCLAERAIKEGAEMEKIMNDFKFAIEMENDGEKYYNEQAEINKDNDLYVVCLKLAKDEKNHAKILTDVMNQLPVKLMDSEVLSNVDNVFKGVEDIRVKGGNIPSQLDFYRTACEKEQQSIDLYTKYLAEADGFAEKELFEFLIKQEKHHYEILDNIVELLIKAEEWVESAEFGVREEY